MTIAEFAAALASAPDLARLAALLEGPCEANEWTHGLPREWYESVDGSYHDIPTWGPETPQVAALIASSCGDGDIVSWDTRPEVLAASPAGVAGMALMRYGEHFELRELSSRPDGTLADRD